MTISRVVVLILPALFLCHCASEHDGERAAIDGLMDSWHKAAAQADEDVFFGLMTKDCIYLGTDISEKWKRDELREWSRKYFDRDTAWDFKPFDREVYISPDGNTAWFDEKLDTWMGPCRGSGVLVKMKGQWKLTHYHLSVTVPNELINGFIELVKNGQPNTDEPD